MCPREQPIGSTQEMSIIIVTEKRTFDEKARTRVPTAQIRCVLLSK